jgi:hypothetical protein
MNAILLQIQSPATMKMVEPWIFSVRTKYHTSNKEILPDTISRHKMWRELNFNFWHVFERRNRLIEQSVEGVW